MNILFISLYCVRGLKHVWYYHGIDTKIRLLCSQPSSDENKNCEIPFQNTETFGSKW